MARSVRSPRLPVLNKTPSKKTQHRRSQLPARPKPSLEKLDREVGDVGLAVVRARLESDELLTKVVDAFAEVQEVLGELGARLTRLEIRVGPEPEDAGQAFSPDAEVEPPELADTALLDDLKPAT